MLRDERVMNKLILDDGTSSLMAMWDAYDLGATLISISFLPQRITPEGLLETMRECRG